MRRISGWMLAATAGALLASCGGGNREVANQQNGQHIRMANPAHDALVDLSPGRQRLAMLRAIRDNGLRCQDVVNAGYQQEYENLRMWVADCTGAGENRSFAVFIAPNEDVLVRNCADAGQLSLPRCEPLPPAQPDPTMPQIKEGSADNSFKGKQ